MSGVCMVSYDLFVLLVYIATALLLLVLTEGYPLLNILLMEIVVFRRHDGLHIFLGV